MPSYEIRLTVTDSRGRTDTETVFVEIVADTPVQPEVHTIRRPTPVARHHGSLF